MYRFGEPIPWALFPAFFFYFPLFNSSSSFLDFYGRRQLMAARKK
jgi:hypothetical protein